ncbi:hypothetical protein HY410_00145 [Candidatus Gottesmanbacteria bacterium]|nr:hypothetical protein [Candidatus Gottesmanbacteria bacterium]
MEKSDPSPALPPTPLVYEETPIIEPVKAPSPQSSHTIATIVFFILLFALGVWLSTFLRQYIPSNVPLESQITPTHIALPIASPTPLPVGEADWKTYGVLSGATKIAIPGISFRLPQDVLAPICDGASCASQGTYLPGGTRFTVAPRGGNQALRDFRGAVVTDAGGRAFTTTPTTVAGKQALEFSGLFTGTTGGGYSFTQMRGVMIEVDSTLWLEINHFTPTGVSADFASDDTLFNEILKTLVLAPI